MLLFALGASHAFGTSVAAALGLSLSPHEERGFEDGEHKARPLVDVRGADVYVMQSLHGGPEQESAEKLIRLLFFLATVRDHGAERVTAVVPYLAYSRKDRRTQPYDPVGSRYIAQLLESVGTDVVITLEVHNPAAFENSFRCRTVHLESHWLFDQAAMACDDGKALVIASPDPGGVKRVQQWREALERCFGRPLGQAFLDKTRREGVVGGSTAVIGDVANATVLVFDDILSSGTTMVRAASALTAAGARRVFVFVAHGLFVAEAAAVLRTAPIERVFISDSVPPFRLPQDWIGSRVEVVPAAPLFAAAIRHQVGKGFGREQSA
ncbi:Ribose-phosphate pyrophosphokinase [Burkholderiales bacterium]|nr:Ribose-phosphate pyrophosphokinase [Burkholderiales bacterium]